MESRPFFLCWAQVSVGMGKGSLLSFSNFFDIVDLNRDVEASMEFFCTSVCFMCNGDRVQGSLLSFANFFIVDDLNRDVDASMEFF